MTITTLALVDDGTMDTVLRCGRCGETFRYNFHNDTGEDPQITYTEFVAWAIADATMDHQCPCSPPNGKAES